MESPARGTKRDAEGSEIKSQGPRRIRPLDIDVVNKIAAGEIIVAPVHALKELIENAIDAGSTQLEILVKDGGLKLLQISDNGHGINVRVLESWSDLVQREDLDILCERFTTSKLQIFEDLSSIATYGFRGEALASISHIAHLTVTSRTKESNCAWRAYYQDGKLAPPKPGQPTEPKPIAGRQGTQITVEDLFYNTPNRLRAFRSSSEEYAKILDMVGRYAVHSHGVAFSCKKYGDASASIAVPAAASILDRVRQIHGTSVANELVNFESKDEKYGFRGECWATNANYHVKRTSLLLFINHRAVDSTAIKRALEQVYATFLPKGGHPFIYLSLEIEPHRVDVNVHPTKREVNFLYEDEIISILCGDLRESLAKVDKSRMFLVQTVLPGANLDREDQPDSNARAAAVNTPISASKTKKPLENNLVRTDNKARKITSMFGPTQKLSGGMQADQGIDPIYDTNDKPNFICRLTSIKELKAEVREQIHRGLTEAFTGHTWVGVVDETRRLVAIQAGVKLFLVNYGIVCQEFFYQIGLTDFGNFGLIKLEPPLDIRAVMMVAAEHDFTNKGGDVTMGGTQDSQEASQAIVDDAAETLISHASMLSEYFSFEITEDGKLKTLPLLLKGYTPPFAKLPRFLLRLASDVEWSDEKACFASFLQELAKFYVPECLPPPPTATDGKEAQVEDEKLAVRRTHIHSALEKVLFPAFRTSLVATKPLLDGVTEIGNLKQLYRIFERC